MCISKKQMNKRFGYTTINGILRQLKEKHIQIKKSKQHKTQ